MTPLGFIRPITPADEETVYEPDSEYIYIYSIIKLSPGGKIFLISQSFNFCEILLLTDCLNPWRAGTELSRFN